MTARELHRAGEVGRNLPVDLHVGELLKRSDGAIAGIAGHYVDAPHGGRSR